MLQSTGSSALNLCKRSCAPVNLAIQFCFAVPWHWWSKASILASVPCLAIVPSSPAEIQAPWALPCKEKGSFEQLIWWQKHDWSSEKLITGRDPSQPFLLQVHAGERVKTCMCHHRWKTDSYWSQSIRDHSVLFNWDCIWWLQNKGENEEKEYSRRICSTKVCSKALFWDPEWYQTSATRCSNLTDKLQRPASQHSAPHTTCVHLLSSHCAATHFEPFWEDFFKCPPQNGWSPKAKHLPVKP